MTNNQAEQNRSRLLILWQQEVRGNNSDYLKRRLYATLKRTVEGLSDRDVSNYLTLYTDSKQTVDDTQGE